MTTPRELADRLELHGRADDLNALAEDGKRLKHSEREAIEAIQTVAMQAAQMLRSLTDCIRSGFESRRLSPLPPHTNNRSTR